MWRCDSGVATSLVSLCHFPQAQGQMPADSTSNSLFHNTRGKPFFGYQNFTLGQTLLKSSERPHWKNLQSRESGAGLTQGKTAGC